MKRGKSPLRPLGDVLAPLIADLQQRSREMLDLASRVRAALPSPEKDHVVAASYKDDTLIVVTDSAAWSSRIRYAQATLLEQVRGEGEIQFTKLRVRVGRQSGA